MITAIDTNVLLDVLTADARHGAASKASLDAANRQGALLICEVVYAELATQFATPADLDQFLTATGIRLQRSALAALHHASEAWLAYHRARRKLGIQCPECGHKHRLACETCGTPLSFRQHILTDFLVGGHALAHADRLLTRDRGTFHTYFPGIALEPPTPSEQS